MKLQLDTTSKTIKLESKIKLSELVETLEKLLPEGLWKEFELETDTQIINWSNPYIIEKIREIPVYPSPYYKRYPWWCNGVDENKIYCTSDNNKQVSLGMQMNSGTYSVDVKS